jgi:hypothetical protein
MWEAEHARMERMASISENRHGVVTRLAAEGALSADSPRANDYDSFRMLTTSPSFLFFVLHAD